MKLFHSVEIFKNWRKPPITHSFQRQNDGWFRLQTCYMSEAIFPVSWSINPDWAYSAQSPQLSILGPEQRMKQFLPLLDKINSQQRNAERYSIR